MVTQAHTVVKPVKRLAEFGPPRRSALKSYARWTTPSRNPGTRPRSTK
jgi:hypothetical protein